MGLVFTGSIYIYLDNAKRKIEVDNILNKYDSIEGLNGKFKYEDIIKHINIYLDNLNYKQTYDTNKVFKEAFKYSFSNILYESLYTHILNNKIDKDKVKENKSTLNKLALNLTLAFNQIDSVMGVESNYEFSQTEIRNKIFEDDININRYLSNITIDKDNLKNFLAGELKEFNSNLEIRDTNIRNKYLYENVLIYKNVSKLYKKTNFLSSNKIILKKALKEMKDLVVNSRILNNIKEKEEYFNYIDKDISSDSLQLNDLDVYINSNSLIKSVMDDNKEHFKDFLKEDISISRNTLEDNLKRDLATPTQVLSVNNIEEERQKDNFIKK